MGTIVSRVAGPPSPAPSVATPLRAPRNVAWRTTRTRALTRIVGPALAGLLGAVFACSSSSSPHPPILGGCTPVDGVPCTAGVVGGGGISGTGDGAAAEDGSIGASGDAASCPGAATIFSASATSNAACIACIAASCCLNPTSCPNVAACSQVATCVLACEPTDPTCVGGCEGASAAATITAFGDLAACAVDNCPTCPSLQTATSDL
jgi:hypothetical protein